MSALHERGTHGRGARRPTRRPAPRSTSSASSRARASSSPGRDPPRRGDRAVARRTGTENATRTPRSSRRSSPAASSRSSASTVAPTSPSSSRRRSATRPTGRLDLARVSQYVATMNGSGPLYDELHRRFEEAAEPQPVHRFLAGLAPVLRERGALAPADHLDALRPRARAGVRGRRARRSTSSRTSPPGRTAASSGTARRARSRGRSTCPNTYATELSLERRTVLLKLHGAVDPVPGARVGELRDHRGRLHRLPRSLRRRLVGAGRAGGAPPAQPLPVRRLRDGRLEPAPRHAPRLGRPAARLPLVGARSRADRRSSRRSGGGSRSTCSTSSRTSTSGCSSGASRRSREPASRRTAGWRRSRTPSSTRSTSSAASATPRSSSRTSSRRA